MIKDNIPFEIKEKILDLAQKLPEVLRSQFVKNTTIRIKDLAQEHPNTAIYGTAGFVIGTVIDNILTFDIPLTEQTISLTGNLGSEIGLFFGVFKGVKKDMKQKNERQSITKIIAEELQNAIKKQA